MGQFSGQEYQNFPKFFKHIALNRQLSIYLSYRIRNQEY